MKLIVNNEMIILKLIITLACELKKKRAKKNNIKKNKQCLIKSLRFVIKTHSYMLYSINMCIYIYEIFCYHKINEFISREFVGVIIEIKLTHI